MRIIHVKAINFMSYEELDLSLDQGLCLIDGFNHDDNSANGAGKTAILDAICYTIFGEIPRNIKMDDVVNRYVKGNCNAEVTLENKGQQYKICRSRNPVDLYIELASGEIQRGKDARETQLLINSFLGIDFNIFVNSVYFSQNARFQFVSASDNDKKQILTNLLDLEIFDKAYTFSHNQVKVLTEEVGLYNSDYEITKKMLDKAQVELNALQEKSDNFEHEKKNKIKGIRNELVKIQATIAQLDEEIKKKQQLVLNSDEIINKIQTLEKDLSALTDIQNRISQSKYYMQYNKEKLQEIDNNIQEIKKLNNAKCMKCMQMVGPDHVKKEIAELKESILPYVMNYKNAEIALKHAETDYTELVNKKEELTKLIQQQRQNDAMIMDIKRLENNKESQKIFFSRGTQELTQLFEITNDFSPLIDDKKKDIAQYNANMAELKTCWAVKDALLQQYTTMKDIYGKIKYYVFENVVNELNARLNKYLSPLFDSDIMVRFATQNTQEKSGKVHKFNTKIVKASKICDFNTLSDGEKRRIEIATNFALSDIVANRSKCMFNLMFLDEILSGSLSKDAAERVVELLKSMKHEKNIFIIDHNAYTRSLIDNIIFVEKRNNISKIYKEAL